MTNGINKSGFRLTFILFVSSVNSGLGVGRERVSRQVCMRPVCTVFRLSLGGESDIIH